MVLPLIRRVRPAVAALGLATLLLAAACSPAAEESTTTASNPPTTVAAAAAGPSTTTTTTASTSTTTATTTLPSTTTTTTGATTTTTAATTTAGATTTTTTLAIPPDNKPPTVEIISPAHLSSHIAVYDADSQRFGAAVSLSAVVSDPNGDDVTVHWISSDEGALGTGESIIATLHTGRFDSAQPTITARATDQWGATTETSVQIIVWIPSDT